MNSRFAESNLQQSIIKWSRVASCTQPELKLLYSIPNGAHVSPKNRIRLLSEGLLKGMPDLCLPIPNGKYGALYLELKTSSGKISKFQKEIHELLRLYSNQIMIVRSIQEAIDAIQNYLYENEK